MEQLIELLPLLIPLVIVQISLLVYTLYHILTHERYKNFNRVFWVVITVVLMSCVGPILYFIFGKEDN